MSLGYVKKKADTRAGKQQIIDEVFNQPSSTKFDDFVNNKELTESTIKDLFDDDDFYTSSKEFDDVSDVKISKMSDEEKSIYKGDGYSCPAFLEVDEKGAIIGIKIDGNVSKDLIEENIAHEIAHIRQARNPELKEQLEELHQLAQNISSPEDIEKYLNHPLEKEANDYASSTINKKKEYTNGKTDRSANEVDTNSSSTRSKEEGSNRSGNDSMDVSRTSEEGTNSSTRPISERIKETNGDLNQVDGLLDETISKDVELSGATWKDLAEDAEAFYRKVKALCGDNLLAFKKAFANNDSSFILCYLQTLL